MTYQLTPLGTTDKTYPIAAFDTEFCAKHNGPDSFICGAITYPDGYTQTVTTGKDLFKQLIRYSTRPYRFYAHNLEVDVANGIYPFLPKEHELKVLSVGYRTLSATINDQNNNYWNFFDSAQISYYASVNQIGELIGYEKGDPGIDLTGCICNLQEELTPEEWRQFVYYCKRDSEIVQKWVNDYLQEIIVNDFNSKLERTAAGTSMNVWRRNHQPETYQVLPTWAGEFIRDSYRGGRTEMFYKGKVDEVYAYDINSLYPYVYSTKDFPHPNHKNGMYNPTRQDLMDHLHYEGFSKVKIESPLTQIPYLHYFDDSLNKLIFPEGTWWGTYTHFELREALKRGYDILDVERCLYFTETCRPFESFGKALYKRRKQEGTSDVVDLVVKLLLNSFYGRFGIDVESKDAGYYIFGDQETIEEKIWNRSEWTNKMANAHDQGDLNYYFEPFGDSNIPGYYQPQWASYITAYARHELYKYFEILGMDNILYVDTDSVFTPKELPKKYIGSELGMVGKDFEGSAHFVREKGYALFEDDEITKVKLSGVNPRYLSDDPEEAKQLAYEALVNQKMITVPVWGGITGSVDWGKVDDMDKTLGSSWKPKRVYNDNGTSKPIRITED